MRVHVTTEIDSWLLWPNCGQARVIIDWTDNWHVSNLGETQAGTIIRSFLSAKGGATEFVVQRTGHCFFCERTAVPRVKRECIKSRELARGALIWNCVSPLTLVASCNQHNNSIHLPTLWQWMKTITYTYYHLLVDVFWMFFLLKRDISSSMSLLKSDWNLWFSIFKSLENSHGRNSIKLILCLGTAWSYIKQPLQITR